MSNAVHSKNTDFRVDDSGGTLRDISNYVSDVQFSKSAPEINTTTFQDTAETFIPNFPSAEFSISGNAHATVMGYLYGIHGSETTSSFQYGPEGTASGKRKYTGEIVCLDVSESGSVNQQNKFTAKFRVSGSVSASTY
jgi:hypothetical protein